MGRLVLALAAAAFWAACGTGPSGVPHDGTADPADVTHPDVPRDAPADVSADFFEVPADTGPGEIGDALDTVADPAPEDLPPDSAPEVIDAAPDPASEDVPVEVPPPACLHDPSLCDDHEACTRDSCDASLGCIHQGLDEALCDDGNACTVDDRCASGACVPGAPLSCDDSDPCTDDPCDPRDGCGHVFNTADCDDGNPCTHPDRCGDGKCAGQPSPGDCACLSTEDCAVFQDGNPCHGLLVCQDRQCVVDPLTVPYCDTATDPPCQRNACDPATGGCARTALPDRTQCDDSNACTTLDLCAQGACIGEMPADCSDGNPCTADACSVTQGCVHVNHSEPCTQARCQDGLLYPGTNCTDGACPVQVPVACTDDDACTVGDTCIDAACRSGPAVLDCDDGNPCTDDVCDPSAGCTYAFNTLPCAPAECTDGVWLAAASCDGGTCPPRVATDCRSGIGCMTDGCDPVAGCSHVLQAGTCLVDGVCSVAGQALPGEPCRVCSPETDPRAWTPLPDGTSCDPGRACMRGRCLGPVITEFMALNKDTLKDEDGDSSDWIEVHNPTVATISLLGWRLTDDPAKPSRWTLPAVSVGPDGFLVVFASDKDRRDPSRPLHANFKLAGEGEFLQLLDPSGRVVQSFGPFPPQVQDASFGPSIRIFRSTPLAIGAPARHHVPAGAPPSGDWTSNGYDDSGAGWSPGRTGIGFVTLATYPPPVTGDDLGVPVADSEADWSVTGTQGENGWTYGFYRRELDPDRAYDEAAFEPFPRDNGSWGPTNAWNGTAWDWYAGDPPWTFLGRDTAQPNGLDDGGETWPIRRWTAEVAGPLAVEWHVRRTGTGGNGVTVMLFHRGVLVDDDSIEGLDTTGITRMSVIQDVLPGDTVDLAVGPEGPDGVPDASGDSVVVNCAIWQMPDPRKDIATDVSATMAGRAPGLFARIPFLVAGPEVPNRLVLRMKYDDGFLAWVNGQPIAASNAPQPAAWDSAATSSRSLSAAAAFEAFPIPGAAALLSPGVNVLALQGMNAAADDPTFLLAPELDALHVAYDVDAPRYYGIPTPGADNDDGRAGLGPLIAQHLTAAGSVASGQDIVVQARVLPTEAPLAGVTLVYRVMYGPEVEVPMTLSAGDAWSAPIPAGAATIGQMVRWYIRATDEAGIPARLPTFLDPLDSEEYFGTIVRDETVVGNLPVVHWYVQDFAAANTRTGTRCQVFFNDEFYDNVQFDLHGQSTSGGAFPKKSYNVDFNSDHRFRLSEEYRRMKDINLLTNYADKSKLRNTLAYDAYRDAGTGYHLAFPVRIQRNGAFFSVADFVEDGDDRWLERLGLDPEAALYKMYDGLYDPAYGEKKTRKWEDSSDLAAFIQGLDATGDALRAYIFDHVSIPAMVDFLAAHVLTANMDCCHKNLYAYRDTNGNGEWRFLPWDVDLTFGRKWILQKTYFDDTMYWWNDLFSGANNKLIAALYEMPDFRDMYVRRVRTLMDQWLQAPGTPAVDLVFEARIDELVSRIGADGALDFAAWPTWGETQTMEQAAGIMKADYLAPRRVFLFETRVADGTIPAAQSDPGLAFGDFSRSPAAPDQAWFSVVNPNAFSVDLSGWRVQGDIDLVLPPGTVLPALGTLYLSPNVVAFRARPIPPTGGQGLLVLGNYTGILGSAGSLSLLDASGNPVPTLVVGIEREVEG